MVTLTALLDQKFKEAYWAPFYGLIAVIPTAFIGGIIGSAISKSYDYDLSNMTSEPKKLKLIRLIRQFKNADEM